MRRATPLILIVLLSFGVAARTLPQEAPEEAEPAQDEATDETEETLADLTIPGTPHELLEGTVGKFNLTIRVWSAPDTEPTETTGTAEGQWILGKRFVETRYEGEVMGRPFEALKIEGFERATDEYVTTWRDNLGTYTMIFRGRCGTTCETRTMTGEFMDPISKQKLQVRGVTTLQEEGGYTYESTIVTPTGVSFKNMELVAERPSP